METSSYGTTFCPECGDAAEDMPPRDWHEPCGLPGYRHVADRTTLCPVVMRFGCHPSEPVEREAGA